MAMRALPAKLCGELPSACAETWHQHGLPMVKVPYPGCTLVLPGGVGQRDAATAVLDRTGSEEMERSHEPQL
ncbi:hypothetical protein V5740_10695 [Croceibacterium sp. TMG7-5b_MA50]|uniref:hypothetical protein n=1 Tax=Croceibacterium sp. TMG7-5b_MA50 TaxID=3121290 RepID=UPI0032217F8F